MLNNATCFSNIYIVCGHTDLRFGIDRLVATLTANGIDNPMAEDILYLFCGRRTDRIKGLVWEGDGYLLLYKRLEAGSFQWPRNVNDVKKLTNQQFRWLMEGLTIQPQKVVKRVKPEYMA